MMDGAQQRMTSSSSGPRTPTVQQEHSEHKSKAVNFSQSQVDLSKAFDTPGLKSTVNIELVTMAEDRDEFREEELNFLSWLDIEIKKIDDFYSEKEQVAAERYKLISAQIGALHQLRESRLTNESNGLSQGISTPN